MLGIGAQRRRARWRSCPPSCGTPPPRSASSRRSVEPLLARLLAALEARIAQEPAETLAAWAERDALKGRRIAWGPPGAAGAPGGPADSSGSPGHRRRRAPGSRARRRRADRARRGRGPSAVRGLTARAAAPREKTRARSTPEGARSMSEPMASVLPIGHIYDLVVADHGRQHAFVCLAAMLIAFMADPHQRAHDAPLHLVAGRRGDLRQGMHLHHFVWGIFLMLGAGFLGLGSAPQRAVGRDRRRGLRRRRRPHPRRVRAVDADGRRLLARGGPQLARCRGGRSRASAPSS